MSTMPGRHAIVTGAGRGIGLAISARLVADGDRVTMLGRDPARLATEQARLGPGARAVVADVTDPAAIARAFDEAQAAFGPIDVLVNNAGAAVSAPALETDTAVWQSMLDVNLLGTWHCIRAALPGMLARRNGRIVSIASTAGLTGYPYVVAYCAAKHGVIGLTRALALELATTGVTVNAVCPGFTETDLFRDAVANIQQKTGRDADAATAALVARNPQKRLIQPTEVADAVAWLVSAAARSMTGQSIAVAGGEVL